ncbi:rifin [Plasmodium falciparum NF54]|uniref:Rifin n=2 Tax=Plasmodium falciparum TaxID=5833 RepID=Q8IJ02_PLAF7|nr:rifin [Plasmodium falciparum 3D7]EWC88229.1 hypothetical protein PFNF54_02974 [Plasmodium falciparum NF54]KAF4330846.1 rifin [Plasmodium falciparum NF54]PKC43637.1 rifin [Plasmodium falciparum NF54]CZT98662.1 rifin [Plasmodium falciparum 3D7]|eukprot:XP_001347684.1 rifin [Plasmodium falciparum 3D7]
MKFSYFNILLFSIPLNILINDQRNHKSTTHHTLKIPITRLLCECELYSPDNYDNDAEMKRVMQQFEDRTSQRFHEYDERMQSKRMQCKDRCDKEIQKIILKDKIEKELSQHLSTLETNIDTNDIPTCVCEKSLADKVEKGCLRCGYGLGTVAPTVGLIGAVAVNELKKAAMAIAIKDAIAEGLVAGETARIQASIKAVILGIKSKFRIDTLGGEVLESIITAQKYDDVSLISESIYMQYQSTCLPQYVGHGADLSKPICHTVYTLDFVQGKVHVPGSLQGSIKKALEKIVAEAKSNAVSETANVTTRQTAVFESRNIAAVDATYASYQTAIVASVVAILVIVLVMLIIYLILRYRRKKKMKKKLQYIKLLKE